MPRATKKSAAVAAVDEPWSYDILLLRSADKSGKSHGACTAHSACDGSRCFQWPTEVGAMVTAPDWDPKPECGGGLHGLAEGLGDWGLLAAPTNPDALWYVCGARRSEAVVIDEAKVKVPRCEVLYVGHLAGAMQMIAPRMSAEVLRRTKERFAACTIEGEVATGARGASSATGYGGASSATGAHGVALAAGWKSRGMVGESCLLVLVERDNHGKIIHHFAAMAGTKGVEPGVWYTLEDGKLVAIP